MRTALKERANAPQGLTLNRIRLDRRAAVQSIDVTCTQCGRVFQGMWRSKYCSSRCSSQARKPRRAADARRCAFPECERPYYAKGHCQSHYGQLRHGREYSTIDLRTDSNGPLQPRLDAYTEKTHSCWLWVGTRNSEGYGQLNVNGAQVYAHRLSYEANVGPIGEGLQIDHLCRVRNCVRPEHLEPVTPAENLRRAAAANPPQPRRNGKFAHRGGETFTERQNEGNTEMNEPTNHEIRSTDR